MKTYYFLAFLFITTFTFGQNEIDSRDSDPLQETSFKLYPNPATEDVVYIKSAANMPKDITIYDVFGEVVLQDYISTKALNISSLEAGVYILKVSENNKIITRKLVVK